MNGLLVCLLLSLGGGGVVGMCFWGWEWPDVPL